MNSKDMKSKSKAITFKSNPSVLAYMFRAMWPSKGFKNTQKLPEFEIRQDGFKFTREQCAALFKLSDAPYTETLPIYFPQVLGFRLVMRAVTDPDFPEPIWNALQLRNEINQYYPLKIGDEVNYRLTTKAYRFLEKGVEADFKIEVQLGGTIAWESITTFYYRIKHGKQVVETQIKPPITEAPTNDTFQLQLGGGLQYGKLSGDYNGIHLFSSYAKMFGFKTAFLHPHRVVGAALTRIPIEINYPMGLDLWFRGPVPYGVTARLAFEQQSKHFSFAVYAEDDRPSLIGRVRNSLL